MRKTTSPSPSSPRPPHAAGISRYGRSGGESTDFHSGPVLVLKTSDSASRRCKRCSHRLVAGRCPSCGLDHRDERRQRQHHLDDILGDDLEDPDEGLLGNREDDDADDEGE